MTPLLLTTFFRQWLIMSNNYCSVLVIKNCRHNNIKFQRFAAIQNSKLIGLDVHNTMQLRHLDLHHSKHYYEHQSRMEGLPTDQTILLAG